MGSSRSKPRKGHEKQQHLPKVGSPQNQAWEHEAHEREHFGTGWRTVALVAVLTLAVIGLLILTL